MQTHFYISYGKENLGPFTIEEIIEKIRSDAISPTGYLYDEGLAKWIPFLESDILKSQLSEKGFQKLLKTSYKTTSHKTENSIQKDSSDDEWYVLRGTRKYGPYKYLKIFKMLQEKKVYEFDFVWKPGLSGWMRIAELECFQSEKLKKLNSSSNIFFRRRHFRFSYYTSIIVHNNKSVWRGESFEVSEGGAGIVMYNSTLQSGEKLHIHFRPDGNTPSFNALCEIVNKKYKKDVVKKDEPTKYGVKFINPNAGVKKALKNLASNKVA